MSSRLSATGRFNSNTPVILSSHIHRVKSQSLTARLSVRFDEPVNRSREPFHGSSLSIDGSPSSHRRSLAHAAAEPVGHRFANRFSRRLVASADPRGVAAAPSVSLDAEASSQIERRLTARRELENGCTRALATTGPPTCALPEGRDRRMLCSSKSQHALLAWLNVIPKPVRAYPPAGRAALLLAHHRCLFSVRARRAAPGVAASASTSCRSRGGARRHVLSDRPATVAKSSFRRVFATTRSMRSRTAISLSSSAPAPRCHELCRAGARS